MRIEATPPERAVWRVLRAAPFETMHFRRQVAFETRYIADFASHRSKVVVEVDGGSHDHSVEYDLVRDEYFTNRGYRTIRLNNSDVLSRDYDLALVLTGLLGL